VQEVRQVQLVFVLLLMHLRGEMSVIRTNNDDKRRKSGNEMAKIKKKELLLQKTRLIMNIV
jgi:hypothetical protein